MMDLSALEHVYVVTGEYGIDEGWWFVCFCRFEHEAKHVVEQCTREVEALTPEERKAPGDKLTIDRGYLGRETPPSDPYGMGTRYRYEQVARWSTFGDRKYIEGDVYAREKSLGQDVP